VKRPFQTLLLLLTGAAVLRISLLGELYLRYVKAGLRPLLIATGVLLLALGLAAAVQETLTHVRGRLADEEGLDHRHQDHLGAEHTHATHGPRIAWLLYVPAVLLLLFAPPALGSYTAARDDSLAGSGAGAFPALPPTDPLPLPVREFTSRAVYDTEHSLRGRTVHVSGFVTPGDEGRWYLSRLLIQCCAADAQVLKVEVRGARAPASDTWVTVTGMWHPTGPAGSAETYAALDATAVEEIPEPADPYGDKAPTAGAR
jgi:uncharacterized repeat protein (TIGR03943 family)